MRSTRSPSRRRAASTVFCAVLTALLVAACGGGDAPDKATASFDNGWAKPLALMGGIQEAPAAPPSPQAPPAASEAEAAAQAASDAGALSAPAESQSAAAESGICSPETSYFASHATRSHYFAENGTLIVQESQPAFMCGVGDGAPLVVSPHFSRAACDQKKLKVNGVFPNHTIDGANEKCACLLKAFPDPRSEPDCTNLWKQRFKNWMNMAVPRPAPILVGICKDSCKYSSLNGLGTAIDDNIYAACRAECAKAAPAPANQVERWF